MEPGDVLSLRTPGGGGYGDPFERPPALVLQDVRRGYYDRAAALREYGVRIQPDAWVVDEDSTRMLRRRGRQ